jgi:hypothetical protein
LLHAFYWNSKSSSRVFRYVWFWVNWTSFSMSPLCLGVEPRQQAGMGSILHYLTGPIKYGVASYCMRPRSSFRRLQIKNRGIDITWTSIGGALSIARGSNCR